jgi:hypothetical protein
VAIADNGAQVGRKAPTERRFSDRPRDDREVLERDEHVAGTERPAHLIDGAARRSQHGHHGSASTTPRFHS